MLLQTDEQQQLSQLVDQMVRRQVQLEDKLESLRRRRGGLLAYSKPQIRRLEGRVRRLQLRIDRELRKINEAE